MAKTPTEIWCETGLYWDYKKDWSEGSWTATNSGGVLMMGMNYTLC